MPKTSKDSAFFDVKPRPKVRLFTTETLILYRIEIDKTASNDELTESAMIQLENLMKRGWSIVATAPFDSPRYNTIIYTLHKPIKRE